MEVNEHNIQQLCNVLKMTMSGDAVQMNRAAKELENLEKMQGFPTLLLKVTDASVPLPAADAGGAAALRLQAAIQLKNIVKRYRAVVKPHDAEQIKQNIIELMVRAQQDERVQSQLSEAIALVAEHEFPHAFPAHAVLVQKLTQAAQRSDFAQIRGILFTAHSIFRKYRDPSGDQEDTERELALVVAAFGQPLLECLRAFCGFALQQGGAAQTNKTAATLAFQCINLVLEIYYDLIIVELPEFFEEALPATMQQLQALLQHVNPLVLNDDPENDEEPAPLLECKTLICDICNLYMEKYEEEFDPYVAPVLQTLFQLVSARDCRLPLYDSFVARCITFIKTVSRSVKHALISDATVLAQICQHIVEPNVTLREADVELFADDATEYIRRDIEGSDNDTRRRSAVELVKGLCVYHEAQMTQIVLARIQALLKSAAEAAATGGGGGWKDKDVALYLVTAISQRATTAKQGTTQVREHVNILDFLNAQVLPELSAVDTTQRVPILKADAIKFACTFRQQIPKALFATIMPLLIQYLAAPQRVIHTYAAWCIERFLSVREAAVAPVPGAAPAPASAQPSRYTSADVKPYAEALFASLFSLLDSAASRENEYVMRCIMRLTAVLQSDMLPFMQTYLTKLTQILARVSQNPTNPTFNHYIFESYATVIKFNPTAVGAFEEALREPLLRVFDLPQAEQFVPYVFQLFAQMLDLRSPPVPALYNDLLDKLLVPKLWENDGNIAGIVTLLASLAKKAPELISAKLNLIFGALQSMIPSKKLDAQTFALLNCIVGNIELDLLRPFLSAILLGLFGRLQKGKTPSFLRDMATFLSLLALRHGPERLIDVVTTAGQQAKQPDIFANVMNVWMEGMHELVDAQERKSNGIAAVKLLCDCMALFGARPALQAKWGPFLKELVQFLEGKKKPQAKVMSAELQAMHEAARAALLQGGSGEDGTGEDDAFQQRAYKVEFSKLSFAQSVRDNPVAQYPDARQYLAQRLGALLQQAPGLAGAVRQALEPADLEALAQHSINTNLL